MKFLITFWISGGFSEPSWVNQHSAQWRSPDTNEKIKRMCVALGLVIHPCLATAEIY